MINEQIAQLNDEVRCTLRASPIHGIGVFALRPINLGDRLHCTFAPRPLYTIPYDHFDQLHPEIRQMIIERHPVVFKNGHFPSPNDDQLLCSFMNHAYFPNYDPVLDCALRDIKEGEEVTEDYRIIGNYKTIWPWLT